MKKILVFSDSHGFMDNMRMVLCNETPDMMIHLGDCWEDACKLHEEFPDIPLEQVPGNCDFQRGPFEKILIIEEKKILICHGHTYHVKSGYLNIEYSAKEKGVDAVLFGHTHQAFYNNHNGLVMLNPGSIGCSVLNPASYGYLTVGEEVLRADVGFIE